MEGHDSNTSTTAAQICKNELRLPHECEINRGGTTTRYDSFELLNMFKTIAAFSDLCRSEAISASKPAPTHQFDPKLWVEGIAPRQLFLPG